MCAHSEMSNHLIQKPCLFSTSPPVIFLQFTKNLQATYIKSTNEKPQNRFFFSQKNVRVRLCEYKGIVWYYFQYVLCYGEGGMAYTAHIGKGHVFWRSHEDKNNIIKDLISMSCYTYWIIKRSYLKINSLET